jgi:ribonuclease R
MADKQRYKITGIVFQGKGSESTDNLFKPFRPFENKDQNPWDNLPQLNSYEAGDVLELEMLSNDLTSISGDEINSARLLARAKSPAARIYEMVWELGYSFNHSPLAMKEVADLLTNDGIDDQSLQDLTHIPFVTIDNDDSKDLDQALHIEEVPANECAGGYIVRYALADAAWYVRPDSALFNEAIERGVTYYLPGFCLPMLPSELSEGLVSLNPNVDRRALIFEIYLSPTGEAMMTNLFRGRINSQAKLSYSGVQKYFDWKKSDTDTKPPHLLSGQKYTESLNLLETVGNLLITISTDRGVVTYERFENYVQSSTIPGDTLSFHLETRTDVSLWNEQISLLCNTEGASFLRHFDIPIEHIQPIFRVHDAPDPEDLEGFSKFVAELVELAELPSDKWLWKNNSKQNVASYLRTLPRDGELAHFTAAIERQLLITNQRSVFMIAPHRHHALAVAAYSRFSSPMREMVGIFTHKEALEQLSLENQQLSDEEDEALRARIIDVANRAKQGQGQLNKAVSQLAIDDLFTKDLVKPVAERTIFSGVILGIQATRLYIRMNKPPVEIKIYVDDLKDCFGEGIELSREKSYITKAPQDGKGLTAEERPSNKKLSGQILYKAGDIILFKVKSFENKRRKWHFTLLD